MPDAPDGQPNNTDPDRADLWALAGLPLARPARPLGPGEKEGVPVARSDVSHSCQRSLFFIGKIILFRNRIGSRGQPLVNNNLLQTKRLESMQQSKRNNNHNLLLKIQQIQTLQFYFIFYKQELLLIFLLRVVLVC